MQSSARQLLIVDTAAPLRRGRRYRIAFSQYRGVIADDLRGLYRSTYRDKQGQQRYVIEWLTVCARGLTVNWVMRRNGHRSVQDFHYDPG